MRVILFCHSLLSDWNHGDAHFLRGVVTELAARGHSVRVFEPEDSGSFQCLLEEPHGVAALNEVRALYPHVRPERYAPDTLDLEAVLDGADLVLVHAWTPPDLVRRIGVHRRDGGRFRLLFHDTFHRSVSAPEVMAGYDLSRYDGVLASGDVLRDLYLERGWARRAWTWHEAADVRVFHPHPRNREVRDLVWIGNWGDDERTKELQEFLVEPVHELGLTARVHGVRYPVPALRALFDAGIEYAGWLPNHRVPLAFSQARVTVHIPRRPYATLLPGVPTIRPFEALACGIPLVSAPWEDSDGLFTAGKDYLVARDGAQMRRHLSALVADAEMRHAFAEAGLRTVLSRHTCAHRVEALLVFCQELGMSGDVLHPLSSERVLA
ncbi:glycosyltransferase [Corallococcus exiguus]|uniref:CgeB family protein n=1 Tax=Corallococcus TaxID=83461 RepID=UPI000F8965EF|nr:MULTISPECIES: glycosyltransferase [Corallococcus]NRD55108.1 glycosyltransferase [Corallococcus exiguus]NRD65868.1 glycosyltransferase [Corallococcus exiguus]RUO95161.1 glycosyltransferase [Corallococcus sp. AB018]